MVLTLPVYWFENFQTIVKVNVVNLDAGRAYPAWIGGWNTYAMLLSFAIIIARFSKGYNSWKYFLLSVGLWLSLISTQSRGGLWFLLIAFMFDYLSKKRLILSSSFIRKVIKFSPIILPIFAFLYFTVGDSFFRRFFSSFYEKNDFGAGVFQSATSGRSVQWLDGVFKLLDPNSIFQYFSGYGLGHYAWESLATIEIELHNTYFQFVYDFGFLFGIIASVGFLFMPLYLKRKSFDSFDRVSVGISVVIVLSGVVQGLFLSTQTGWIISMFIAFIVFQRKYKKFDKVQ